MADVKYTQLPVATQANAADIMSKVDSVSGVSQQMTVAQIINGVARAENYGGATPNWTPIGSLGFAVDISNNQQWTYVNGAWI